MTKTTKPGRKKLTTRHLAFVDGLFLGLNQTDSYCEAYGIKPASKGRRAARTSAYDLMRDETIIAEIERRRKKLNVTVEASAERIIQELSTIAFADPIGSGLRVVDGQVIITETAVLPDHLRRAIAEISQTEHGAKVKFHSKEAALRMLGQYRKLFVVKVEHDITDSLAERLAEARKRAKGTA